MYIVKMLSFQGPVLEVTVSSRPVVGVGAGAARQCVCLAGVHEVCEAGVGAGQHRGRPGAV